MEPKAQHMMYCTYPCRYLRGHEYVGGVEHEPGGEGRPEERGHVAPNRDLLPFWTVFGLKTPPGGGRLGV